MFYVYSMSDDNVFYTIPKSEHHISLRLYQFLTYCGGSVPVFCSLSTTEMKIALLQIWVSLPDYAWNSMQDLYNLPFNFWQQIYTITVFTLFIYVTNVINWSLRDAIS